MRAKEFAHGTRDLVIFDIDDTLLHTTAKIKVIDADGNFVRDLTNQEFNNYQLQPGEQFDFGEFRSAEKFRQESKPIVPMVRKLKTILAHAGNAKVIMLTARADFDNKEEFLQTFHDLGIDMSRIHVHRAGNIPGDAIPAEKKAVWVRKYLNTKQYGHVRLYDDSMSNLRVFKALKQEYPNVDFRAIYVGPEGSTQTVESQQDYEIRNYKKLDSILTDLCKLVVKGQREDADKYGMVAAAVLDLDQNLVKAINLPGPNGKRRHAERVAIDRYLEQYGDIPEGSIIITTCSPCSEHMDERYGEDCTKLINQHGVKKVYAGYMDPTQEEEHRDFNIIETENDSIRDMCKEFADTFLHLRESVEEQQRTLDPDIYEELPPAFLKRIVANALPGVPLKFKNTPEGYLSVRATDGSVKLDIGSSIAEGDIAFNIENAYLTKHQGAGVMTKIINDTFLAVERKYGKPQSRSLNVMQDRSHGAWQAIASKLGVEYNANRVVENFADGKNPGRKGLAKRSGVNCKASVSTLRNVAKHSSGEKQRMAHWCANMKSGRNK